MVKKIIALMTSLIFLVPTWGLAASPLVLTQQSVAEMVLKQGLKTKEVNITAQKSRLDPAKVLSDYDWNLQLQSGYLYNKQTGLSSNSTSTLIPEYKSYVTTASFGKKLATTGTLFAVTLERTSQDYSANSNTSQSPPSEQTWDRAGLLIEQSLLKNFFGQADRAAINAANFTYEAAEISRADDLEQVVLDTIQAFWITYVAQEKFKQAVNSRDRYKTLVDAVRRKTSLGYSNPGDLPQVQAEFEGREQNVKSASVDYLKNLDSLLTLLNLESGAEVRLEISKSINPVPTLEDKKVEDKRSIRSQKLRVDAAQENLTASKSNSYPSLDFVGNFYSTGQGLSSSDSYSELMGADRPSYYAGLRLKYNFGADIQNETLINKKLDKELQEAILKRQTLEAKNDESRLKRSVQAYYAIAISAQKQKDFREKAQKELNRSYNQGRTDIQTLITAMNALFSSEVTYVNALGDYSIALNQWAAYRDELIPDQNDSTSGSK